MKILNAFLLAILTLIFFHCAPAPVDSNSLKPVEISVEDPFLWLENIDSDSSLNWVKEKNEATVNELKQSEYFQPLYDKILEISNSNERLPHPKIRGNYIYNTWKDGTHKRGIWRRTSFESYESENPVWESVLDIDKLNESEGENFVFSEVITLYPGTERCLLALSPDGGDAQVFREFDLSTKTFVENGFYIPKAKSNVDWVDKNHLLVGTDFGSGSMTVSGYPRIVKLWTRGTSLEEAITIFEGEQADVSAGAYTLNSQENKYIIVYRWTTFYTKTNYLYRNNELIKLDIPEDADLTGIFKKQLLIQLKSDWKINNSLYKQGSLLSVNVEDFLNGSRDFNVVIEPDDISSILTVSQTQNYILVNMIKNIRGELHAYKLNGNIWTESRIPAPDFGTIKVHTTSSNSDKFYFSYKGFLNPATLFSAEGHNKIKKLKSSPEFFNSANLIVNQYFTISKDGTKIPYFIIFPENMKLDGNNPTLLYGYGGFEISEKPFYSGTIGSAWMEKGGVFALANIRGGGEFGPRWHQSALKENRQRAYDDFTAIAEDLIKRNITSPKHLGIRGGSNGGLLVGVAFTQHPELYNAVICRVPLLDMKRYNKLLAGASWMAEYGNPDIPEEWAYISKYSPYQNVFPGKNYPKVFFNTSTRDDRVHPGHARKMVAKMESFGYPVYYYENTEGGHKTSTNNEQYAFINALMYSYLWESLK